MRVLIVHNRYQQAGGEDNVVTSETALLRERGHVVEVLLSSNDHIQGALSQVKASITAVYSPQGKTMMAQAIKRTKPDVVHVHNFFPTLSPSIFRACSESGAPVVYTLHNYRLVCAAATMFRDGKVCEECLEQRSFLPGVLHACYRSSRLASFVSGASMAVHDHLGTWENEINRYIALTEFAGAKMSTFRVPREKIDIKPNFAMDYGVGPGDGSFALFVGRLTPEKGILTLLDADRLGKLCMDVVILGDGPLRNDVEMAASRPETRLTYRGAVTKEAIRRYMREARVLIFPSVWHEGLPLVLVEAFSCGLPVLAANLPNVASLISEGETGALFESSSAEALATGLRDLSKRATLSFMRHGARTEYLRRYTPDINYQILLSIYRRAIEA